MSPAAIEAIIILVAKYGPGIVTDIKNLFAKPNPTVADVEALFANVKPWDQLGIPDKAPAVPAS